mgnify:CR=1 FL=1
MSEYNVTLKDARTGERFSGHYIIQEDIWDEDYVVVSQTDREDFILLNLNFEVDHEDSRYNDWLTRMKDDHTLLVKALIVCKNRCGHEDDYAGLHTECTNPHCPVHVLFGRQDLQHIH